MDRRFFLALIACLAFTFLLQVGFEKFGPKRPVRVAPPAQRVSAADSVASPVTSKPAAPEIPAPITAPLAPASGGWESAGGAADISVESGSLRIGVSSLGAKLTRAEFPLFALPTGGPVDLLRRSAGNGDWTMVVMLDGQSHDLAGVPFRLEPIRDSAGAVVGVQAAATHESGLRVVRSVELTGEYTLRSTVRIVGVSAGVREASYAVRWANGLPIVERNPQQDESSFAVVSTVGSEFRQEHTNDFGKSSERPYSGNVQWVGVRTKYFTSILIPPRNTATRLVATGDKEKKLVGYMLPMPLLPGRETVHDFQMYIGPIDHKRLEVLAVGADRMASLGWSWTAPLAQLLLWCLVRLYDLIPNYGIGIILVSAATRVVFYPLTRSSFKSMASMQSIQPQLQELQRKHKGNPERLNKETMALFRDNKVNPLGGCIPMLVQMPVFVALFGVLSGAVQLRGAHFGWWIKDLSSPDVIGSIAGIPIHILPIVMTLTSLWQAKLTPTDPRQMAMTYLMPVVMMFMFYSFPSGTVLYWTVNNIMTIAQQYAMKLHAAPAAVAAQRTQAAR